MAIFLPEENKALKGKSFEIPKDLKKHLGEYFAIKQQYSKEPGYKKLQHLLNPEYNDRSKGKKTQGKEGVPYGSLKRLKNAFDYAQPNGLEYNLMGGEEMRHWVNDTLNRERTKVKPVLPQAKTSKNKLKPSKISTNQIKSGDVKVNLKESYSHPYFDYLEEYDERDIYMMFLDKEKPWTNLINPESYQKALQEFVQYGELIRFPSQKIYQWFGTVMRNTAILRALTSIAGHDNGFDTDTFLDTFFYDYEEGNIDYQKWEEYKEEIGCDDDYGAVIEYLDSLQFFEWFALPDGSDPWSDFGIEPLEKIINEYSESLSPEEVLVLLNKALDVAHMRGDLSSIFIVGGRKTLSNISGNLRTESKKKTIRLTESQLLSLQGLLTESQESKSIDAAKKLVIQRGYSHEEADKIVRHDIRGSFPFFTRNPKGGKFILGVTRMFLDGQIRDAQTINNINTTLKYVVSDAHYNEYDRNLNGISAQELIQRFAKNVEMDMEMDRNEVNSMSFEGSSQYDIVRIDSFEQACEYNKYTYEGSPWCLTYSRGNYDSYTCNGVNQIYFCLKKGFESTPPRMGENCPLDEYGLSMISVIVNENGSLAFCTSRWNHKNGGNDNIMGTKQISQVVGRNFYGVFKPNNRWKEMVENALQRLRNGEDPNDVFDDCGDFHEGLAVIILNEKWNWVDTEGNLLSPSQWFDDCGNFYNGLAWVELNGKYNWVDTECNPLSPNQWFDWCSNFVNGFAAISLNGKYNWIDTEGNLLSPNQWFDGCNDFKNNFAEVELNGNFNFIDTEGNILSPSQWFDWCGNFYDGFAKVKLNGKFNFIDTEGNILSPNQWFGWCEYFRDGLGKVRLNGKYNFIDTEGNLLWEKPFDQWFDGCGDFYNGFARVELNGNFNFIDTEGNLYNDDTRKPLGINVKTMNSQNESINTFVNIIMENMMDGVIRK